MTFRVSRIGILIGIVALIGATAVGCGSSGDQDGGAQGRPVAKRVVSLTYLRQHTTECSKPQVRAVVEEFAGAFSAGRVKEADSMVAEPPFFVAFGSNNPGSRKGVAAKNRRSLESYLQDRRDEHDRLRFDSLRIAPPGIWYTGIFYKQTRSADDLRKPSVTRPEKGAVACFGRRAQIILLNL